MIEKPAFLVALEALEKSSPADIVSKLFGVFESITRMDEAEVVAAYQAIKFAARRAHLAHEDVALFLDTAEARMYALYDEARNAPAGPGRDRVHRLAALFTTILGFPIYEMEDVEKRQAHRKTRLSP